MGNKNQCLILLLFIQFAFGQLVEEKTIFCKIHVSTSENQNVNIVNVRTNQTTVSNKEGIFKILVKQGDVLVLSSVSLETIRKTITKEDFNSQIVSIKMNTKINNLKEVNVSKNNTITAENLGIISKGQKKYTPAERKLYTANSGILDPLLNKISGRTAMLKKEVAVERKEKLLIKLDGFFEDQYYIDVLKIPKEHIKGFQYFLIDDNDFVSALKAKNKTMAQFLVKPLASNYNEIIKQE